MSNDQTTAQTWLRIARADLALAEVSLPEDALYELLCFHAQQAAEKAIKAVLLYLDLDFPFVHDLRLLANLLPADLRSAPALTGVEALTAYAVTTRYPFSFRDDAVDKNEYDEAIRIADEVVRWAAAVIDEPRQKDCEDE
jgi:HEPN domain-containing protein